MEADKDGDAMLAVLGASKGDDDEGDEGDMPDKGALMGDLMSAIKSGDKDAAATAFEAMVAACEGYDDTEEM